MLDLERFCFEELSCLTWKCCALSSYCAWHGKAMLLEFWELLCLIWKGYALRICGCHGKVKLSGAIDTKKLGSSKRLRSRVMICLHGKVMLFGAIVSILSNNLFMYFIPMSQYPTLISSSAFILSKIPQLLTYTYLGSDIELQYLPNPCSECLTESST